MTAKVLSTLSKEDIEQQIDELIKTGVPYSPLKLVLPADSATYRYPYKDFFVRVWHDGGIERFDTAVEVNDGRH